MSKLSEERDRFSLHGDDLVEEDLTAFGFCFVRLTRDESFMIGVVLESSDAGG